MKATSVVRFLGISSLFAVGAPAALAQTAEEDVPTIPDMPFSSRYG